MPGIAKLRERTARKNDDARHPIAFPPPSPLVSPPHEKKKNEVKKCKNERGRAGRRRGDELAKSARLVTRPRNGGYGTFPTVSGCRNKQDVPPSSSVTHHNITARKKRRDPVRSDNKRTRERES